MLINSKYNFIYIRPTKVASTSIMENFINLNNDPNTIIMDELCVKRDSIFLYNTRNESERKYYLHPNPEAIVKIIDDEKIFEKFTVVTSIRNPFHRAVSMFLFQHVMLKKNLESDFYRFILRSPTLALRRIIFSIQTRELFNLFIRYAYRPLSHWTNFRDNEIVDFYLRTENLDEDFKNFCKNKKIDYTSIQTKNTNNYNKQKMYDHFLTENNKRIIFQKDKKIFEKYYGDYC